MGLITANKATVRSYLLKEYEITEQVADDLINKYAELIAQGERMMSGAYYVGDEIASNEHLLPAESDDWDEEDEEDDDDDW